MSSNTAIDMQERCCRYAYNPNEELPSIATLDLRRELVDRMRQCGCSIHALVANLVNQLRAGELLRAEMTTAHAATLCELRHSFSW
jgi:hypothetical protein